MIADEDAVEAGFLGLYRVVEEAARAELFGGRFVAEAKHFSYYSGPSATLPPATGPSLASVVNQPRTVKLESVTSTQEVARALPVGSVVVADHQTAGRGRLDRSWEAPPGSALLASFVLQPRSLLSLAAGVAAAEACGSKVRLKWPNDLMLGGRKLGGILIEVSGAKAIAGIGINLSWSPPGAARLDRPRDQLLEDLIEKLEGWTSATDAEILARWQELSSTIGQRVRVELPGRTIEGIAESVNDQGALIVDGTEVHAGDVIHLRPRARAARAPAGSRRHGRK